MIADAHDALSIHAAARTHGDAPAVITRARTLTFAQAAAAATAHAHAAHAPVIAHPSLDTVLAIYAALAAEQPITLLHARAPATAPPFAPPPGTLCVLHTSGSTGTPRPIALARRAFLAAARAHVAHLGTHDDDRHLCCLPLAHTGGLSVVLRALVLRHPLVLHEGDFDADAVAALARDTRATITSMVPTQLDVLSRAETLRAILLGGAAAPRALLDRARAAQLPFLRTYGLTETWGQVATARVPGDPDAPLRPLPGVIVRAGTADAPAPITIDGPTLSTRGPMVTSDLGVIDTDGGLIVIGRADDVIITGGENVHPAEVEAAVAAAPGVVAACAFGLPDARWGQIVACAIVAPPQALDAVRAWLAPRLPPHLLPRRLVALDALPLLATGKIDRRGLAARIAATL